jgi:hypothetical protein
LRTKTAPVSVERFFEGCGRFARFRCFYHPTRALLWQVLRTYNESRIDQATRVGLSAACMAVSNRALIGEPKGRQGCSRAQRGARAVVDLSMRFSRSCLFIRFYHLGMLLARVLGCGGRDVPGHSDWSDDAALASACKAQVSPTLLGVRQPDGTCLRVRLSAGGDWRMLWTARFYNRVCAFYCCFWFPSKQQQSKHLGRNLGNPP